MVPNEIPSHTVNPALLGRTQHRSATIRAISERPKKKSGTHGMKSTIASVHHATCLTVRADGRVMVTGASFMRSYTRAIAGRDGFSMGGGSERPMAAPQCAQGESVLATRSPTSNSLSSVTKPLWRAAARTYIK
jgi:hypothetical protein